MIILEGQTKKSINLETSKGNKIDNYQIFELSAFEKNQFTHYSKEKYPFVIFRNSPSPIYNCHGMSFASRRTNIDKSTDLKKILEDDGYIEIEKQKVLAGDIVLYITPEDGDISHSGIVVKIDVEHTDNYIIFVVSKWGKYKEVIHTLYDCPYTNCLIKFYRITHEEYEI